MQIFVLHKENKNKRIKGIEVGYEDIRKKGKERGKGKHKNCRNPCKLSGHHNREYSDCKFNKKSSNYCGITRTLKIITTMEN